jgi:CBS domain-containing protein
MSLAGLVACCGAGIIAGLFSSGLSGLLYKTEDWFQKLPIHWMWWCTLGGLAVGLGGYFQPRALGVGYDVIEDLLQGHVVLQAALALLVVKSLIWVVSLASGTSGGVLAPLLMMGCGLGVVEAQFFPEVFRSIYPMISMAAVMGGMMRAPFTAVMFTLELTHNLDSLVPAMTATIFAYAVTVLVMKRSILTEKIARRGFHVFREYVVDPLEITEVAEVMTRDVISVPMGLPLDQVVTRFFNGKAKHRGYPVLDEQGRVQGMITASDILKYRLGEKVTQTAVVTVESHESCRVAAERMAFHGVGRLPVVERQPKGYCLVGIVTRSDLLKPRLIHHEAEAKRERFFTPGVGPA